MAEELATAGELEDAAVSYKAKCLAHKLVRIHGPGYFSRESGGLHLNIPSPKALALYGAAELNKKHLAVNLDKYLGEGKYEGRGGQDMCARCMKTQTAYALSELMEMPPLAERGIKATFKPDVRPIVNKNYLISDGAGNMVPLPPGATIPLSELSEDHPAVWYVRQRNFDPASLTEFLGAAYCTQEFPEGGERRIFYPRLARGFKDTPQGRIIFQITHNGVNRGWQARLIDHTDDVAGYYYVFHPYAAQWIPVKVRQGDTWVYCDGFSAETFKVSKYRTGFGTRRRDVLMGFDAAVRWNAGRDDKAMVLVEGPLDAARWGPPAVAVLGKHLSDEQASLLLRTVGHGRVLVPADRDESGAKLLERVTASLGPKGVEVVPVDIPGGAKDVGDLSNTEVDYIKKFHGVV